MGKSKLYKDDIKAELQKQLKLLEPEYKKIKLKIQKLETIERKIKKDDLVTRDEYLIFYRYLSYKSQEERITGGEEYQKRLEKQCKEFLVSYVRHQVKYHKVIGDDNPEYREKYEKYKKTFEEFLLVNNDDGKLFDYLALNEQDFRPVINNTIKYTLQNTAESTEPLIYENMAGLVKGQEEILRMIKDISFAQTRPAWRKHLIDNGFVYDDGKRIVNSLKETAAEYVIFIKQNVTMQFLEENFRKPDGEKYSSSMYSEARDYANSK